MSIQRAVREEPLMNVYASLPTRMALHFLSHEHGLNDIDYWCIYALHRNGDWEGVKTQLRYRSKRRVSYVTKFYPGDHYHCLGVKFDTYREAEEHLEQEGYICGGLKEQHTYIHSGD